MEEEEEKANHLEIARVRFPGLGFLSFYLCFVFFFRSCFCFTLFLFFCEVSDNERSLVWPVKNILRYNIGDLY